MYFTQNYEDASRLFLAKFYRYPQPLYYSRMMDTINQVLMERRKIKLGRVKIKNDSSPSKQESLGLSLYKSQRKILSTSPKAVVKRKVEIMVQNQEDQNYKNMKKELQKKAIQDQGPSKIEIMKFKQTQKIQEANKKRRELELLNQRKIDEYKEVIDKKERRIEEFKSRKMLARRASQTSSPSMRHVQSQENIDYLSLLDQIEERCKEANTRKNKEVKQKAAEVQKKNLETQRKLQHFYKSENKIEKNRQLEFQQK